MAKQVIIRLNDDLDPTQEATAGTVLFGHNGVDYEIDLSEENAAKLNDALAPFVAAARRVTSGPRRRRSRSSATGTKDSGLPLAEIREWAQANGHKVSNRGRVSAEIVRLYDAAKAGGTAEAEPTKAKGRAAKAAPEFSNA